MVTESSQQSHNLTREHSAQSDLVRLHHSGQLDEAPTFERSLKSARRWAIPTGAIALNNIGAICGAKYLEAQGYERSLTIRIAQGAGRDCQHAQQHRGSIGSSDGMAPNIFQRVLDMYTVLNDRLGRPAPS
jgi:hypothetical protein